MRHLVLISLISLVAAACGGDTTAAQEGGDGEASSPVVESQASASDDSDRTSGSESAQGEDLPFENGEGFFIVDGERIDPEYVVSCIPFDASEFGGQASHPDDLAINAIKGSTALQVEVSYEEGAGRGGDQVYDAVSVWPNVLRPGEDGQESFEAGFLTDPDGVWYSRETDNPIQLSMGTAVGTPLDEAPMVRDGNRITGTATLPQTWPDGATGSVVVSYDLSFSSEQFDCSTR